MEDIGLGIKEDSDKKQTTELRYSTWLKLSNLPLSMRWLWAPISEEESKCFAAVNAQIQNVIQNFGHHVQASLKSIELDLM